MTANGWTQILLFALIVFLLVKPLGIYMFKVFEGDRQPLPRFFGLIERWIYRLCGVDPKEQLVAVFMVQSTGALRVYHRTLFRQLVYQAIVD